MNDVFANCDVLSNGTLLLVLLLLLLQQIYNEMHKNPFVALHIERAHIP